MGILLPMSSRSYRSKLLYQLFGYFPHRLPVGEEGFEKFYERICFTYDFPHHPAVKNAIATLIMHLGPTCQSQSPFYFAKSVRKSQANQVAFDVLQRLKAENKDDGWS